MKRRKMDLVLGIGCCVLAFYFFAAGYGKDGSGDGWYCGAFCVFAFWYIIDYIKGV